MERLFHYKNGISTYHSPVANGLNIYANATGKNMYIKLTTYKIVIADQSSKNLESQSRPLFATCTSWSESLP
jgi:hypothetical protein